MDEARFVLVSSRYHSSHSLMSPNLAQPSKAKLVLSLKLNGCAVYGFSRFYSIEHAAE